MYLLAALEKKYTFVTHLTSMDNSKHITYFKVENFKRFQSFELDQIGEFNLIVGDNNVGKTTVLEGLLLNEDPLNSFLGLNFCLSYREIYIEDSDTIAVLNQYQNKSLKDQEIKYIFNYSPKDSANYSLKGVKIDSLNKDELSTISNEIIIHKGQTQLLSFSINGTKSFIFPPTKKDEPYHPMIPVNLGYRNDLVEYYSKNVQNNTSMKKEFLDNLKLFSSSISDVEISTTIAKGGFLIIRKRDIDEAQPLTMFGEGIVRLTRILLEIIVNKGSRLMIDEIDTGIHHSRFKKFWKTILQSAVKNNVQIFATTHSKECLQYFKEVLEENEMESYRSKSRCFRLIEQKDESVKAVPYDFEQFQFAIDQENEMR